MLIGYTEDTIGGFFFICRSEFILYISFTNQKPRKVEYNSLSNELQVIEKLKDIVHFLHLEIRNNFGSAGLYPLKAIYDVFFTQFMLF